MNPPAAEPDPRQRASAFAAEGRYQEALDLLADAAASGAASDCLALGQAWLRQPGIAPSLSLDFITGTLVPRLLKMTTQAPPAMPMDDPRRANMVAAQDMLLVLRHYFPNEAQLFFAASVVARRLGEFDEAMALAHQAFQLRGDWNTAVGVALACRDSGRIDDAIGWFRHAHGLQPDELSPLLDIGDTCLGAERWDDAIAAYREVLAREPAHLWAEPSALYAQYRKNPEPGLEAELFELTDRSRRAWDLCTLIRPPEPFVHELPLAADATANALRGVIEHLRENPAAAAGGKVALSVTHPESPSVLTAFGLFRRALGVPIELELGVETVQTPDPRVPKSHVDFSLWTYEGTTPKVNLPEPEARVSEAIATLAKHPYNLELWEPRARALAEEMGPAWNLQLASVMIHPPALPDPSFDPIAWVQRVQVAAALTLGYLDDGWEGSVRKRALFSLALGPSDWTTDAALIVLAWLARHDPAIRADVEQLFAWLEQQVPTDGYTSWELPLVTLWLGLGSLDEATKSRLEEKRDRILTRG